jgi:SAM-dependent methyltransferase
LAVEEYQRVVTSLRQAYGAAAAAERDAREKETFKVDERRRFLDLLRDRSATSLLEVGAGTGHDSLFFQEQGLRVLCTDLSPAMVELCQAKGLDARVADFLSLGVPPASFDAVYALNCLLHVPTPDLARVLEAIGEVLVPGGPCYVGTWGGADEEGPMGDDHYPVPRFFAFRSDQVMSKTLAEHFRILSFTTFDPGGNHFQSFVLEKPIQLRLGKAPPLTRFRDGYARVSGSANGRTKSDRSGALHCGRWRVLRCGTGEQARSGLAICFSPGRRG